MINNVFPVIVWRAEHESACWNQSIIKPIGGTPNLSGSTFIVFRWIKESLKNLVFIYWNKKPNTNITNIKIAEDS